MKRGTPGNPKLIDLARRLGVPRYAAVGILEMLWHYTAQYAPRGDIGRHGDETVLAEAVGWTGDPTELVLHLRGAGWLDLCRHGLHVHDWPDHADQTVQRCPAVAGSKAQQDRKKKEPQWEWQAPGFSACYVRCAQELELSRGLAGKIKPAVAVADTVADTDTKPEPAATSAAENVPSSAFEADPAGVGGTSDTPQRPRTAQEAWDRVLAFLEPQINAHSFAQWFRPTAGAGVRASDRELVVGVPSRDFVTVLAGKYAELVGRGVALVGLEGWTVRYDVRRAGPWAGGARA